MWKKFATDYLTFSKKDRVAIIALLSLFGLIIILPRILPSVKKTEEENPAELIQQLRAATIIDSANKSEVRSYNEDIYAEVTPSGKLFYFDPNTITTEQWKQLGVGEKTAATIRKYISKGGKFSKPDDLLKVYTLKKQVAERLIPYVRIQPSAVQETDANYSQNSFARPVPEVKALFAKKSYRNIEINTADTTEFMALPGIGSRLAVRIVNLREALGGFVSPDQVAETRYLHDSVFQKIRPYLQLENTDIKKLNINSATVEQLIKHPYIEVASANAIVQYRNQHGAFKSTNDLRKLHGIPEEFFKKAGPYITVE